MKATREQCLAMARKAGIEFFETEEKVGFVLYEGDADAAIDAAMAGG